MEITLYRDTQCCLYAHTKRKQGLNSKRNDLKAQTPLRSDGGLADIAPTLLQILNLEQPNAMTGRSLIEPVSNVDTAPMTARLPQPV